jgi:hypothetical protein
MRRSRTSRVRGGRESRAQGNESLTSDVPIADDIRLETQRLSSAAMAAGLGLRLMGGLAIWLTSPSVRRQPFAREYRDIDFAVRGSDSRAVTPFLEREGYVPERLFNSLHGAQRLNFGHPDRSWTIDVIVDALRMSHRIDLRGRLAPGRPTLDLADLLLTKLQVREINTKDLGDLACLVADHPLVGRARDDGDAIDLARIVGLTGSDWGLCHTSERNLREMATFARDRRPDGAPFDPTRQAETLLEAIHSGRKAIAWRLRARVGERVRWYETPEEVRH